MSFLADIHSYWQSSSTLNTALPATSVYTGLVPESQAFPYAVLTSISADSTFLTGKDYVAAFTFQVSIFSSDPDQAESIGQAVLGGLTFQPVSASTISCILTDGPILLIDQDTPARVYHCLLTFQLTENASLP